MNSITQTDFLDAKVMLNWQVSSLPLSTMMLVIFCDIMLAIKTKAVNVNKPQLKCKQNANNNMQLEKVVNEYNKAF